MNKLRAGVIGVGYLGRFHAEKYAACKGVELLGVADSDHARAKEVGAKLRCTAFFDYRELLPRVDVVSIAVPTESHHAVAQAALEAGVHVLLEKPLTRTLEEAASLVALARERGLRLGTGHLERFNPAFRALEKQLDRPLFIDCERLSGFKQRGTDVDVVLDLMIHDLDLVLAMVRSEPESVSACGFSVLTDSIDIANARLEFPDGCVANLSASRVSQSPVRKLRVFQSDLYISADLQAAKLRAVRKAAESMRTVETETGFDGADALRAEVEAFVAAVREGREPPVTGEDGRRALALALEVGRLVRERLARFSAASGSAAQGVR